MGFDLGGIGSMIGGVVGGMFGGPIGAQIGSMIGGQIGQMLQQMMSQFGPENVAGGLSNCINQNAANVANQHVDNCGLPQFIKDEMKGFISDWLSNNTQSIPSDCQNACDSVYDQVTNGQCQGSSTQASSADSYKEAQNNAMRCNAEEEAEESKEGKGTSNWLVALAGALAEVQAEFLTSAMKNMETMRENSQKATQGKPPENESPEQKEARQKDEEAARNEFLMAQSQYQANMQMFNMVANMTATSLKSLGEGLTSIARKQ
ncbi:MAG: hypothetical protein JAY82_16830 [Candidatus Thiodiazotropha taylori]|nr:hypothetical protein [Candidatus Thiodiazotropha taylori]